jgi:hypothetical protein
MTQDEALKPRCAGRTSALPQKATDSRPRTACREGPQAGMNVPTNEPENDTVSRCLVNPELTIEIAPTRFPYLNTAS